MLGRFGEYQGLFGSIELRTPRGDASLEQSMVTSCDELRRAFVPDMSEMMMSWAFPDHCLDIRSTEAQMTLGRRYSTTAGNCRGTD